MHHRWREGERAVVWDEVSCRSRSQWYAPAVYVHAPPPCLLPPAHHPLLVDHPERAPCVVGVPGSSGRRVSGDPPPRNFVAMTERHPRLDVRHMRELTSGQAGRRAQHRAVPPQSVRGLNAMVKGVPLVLESRLLLLESLLVALVLVLVLVLLLLLLLLPEGTSCSSLMTPPLLLPRWRHHHY